MLVGYARVSTTEQHLDLQRDASPRPVAAVSLPIPPAERRPNAPASPPPYTLPAKGTCWPCGSWTGWGDLSKTSWRL